MAILEISNLTKDFGGLRAVGHLNFDVERGGIHGLIGPNGAGKTTVFNLVTGFIPTTNGSVVFNAKDITNLKPHIIAQKGLVRTFQLTSLFNNLSVLNNILIGCHFNSHIGFLGSLFKTSLAKDKEQDIKKKAIKILKFLGLYNIKDELAKNLPHGHQRALEIAVAMGAEPKLLMLDEPFTGMNIEETKIMMGIVSQLRETGITIVLVEHDMRAVMGLCDRITVLDFGTKIAEGTPEEIRRHPEVIKVYLGA